MAQIIINFCDNQKQLSLLKLSSKSEINSKTINY